MAAPTNAAFVKKVLANSEPSTHGPKADILIAWANVRFRGQSGHRNLRASRPLLTHNGHFSVLISDTPLSVCTRR
jgi:hypothetical protein